METKLQNKMNVLVTGCSVPKGLRTILGRIREQNETLTAMKNMADKLGMSVEEYATEIGIIGCYPEFSYEVLEKLSHLYDDSLVLKESISNLKKRIKYCKNPMERKRLQKELNSLYKEQKGKKKS